MAVNILVGVLLAAGLAFAFVRTNEAAAETFLRGFRLFRKYVFTVMWLALALVFIAYGYPAALLGFFILLVAFIHVFTTGLGDVRDRLPF